MNLENVFDQILILFLILLIGFGAKKLKAVGDGFKKGLTDFIMNIALPALIISSMSFEYSIDTLRSMGIILAVSIVIYALSAAIGLASVKLLRVEGLKKRIFVFITIFSNSGYMGFPVIKAVYGNAGQFYASVCNLPFNVLLWTIGVMIMQGGRKEKGFKLKDLINPGIVSLVVGFLMFLFSIKLPAPVSNAISLVGSTTTPMSMVLIGIILAEESIVRAFTDIKVFAMSFVRLIVVPFISLLVLKQFVNNPLVQGVPVMVAAMPAGTVTAMFAEKYGTDTYAASQSIFISTLFSIVTIPIMVYIIGTM